MENGRSLALASAGRPRGEPGLCPVRLWTFLDPGPARIEAHRIAADTARALEDYGRDTAAFSQELAAAGAHIIRGEVDVYDALAAVRQRLRQLGITD